MSTEALSSATGILGPNARRARDYPGAQHVPLDYPGRRPETSFLYLAGSVAPVRASSSSPVLLIHTGGGEQSIDEFLAAHGLAALNRRHAILAVGSNACPGRLEEKFSGKDHDAIIALKGWIVGVDSIYAAWLAAYGALPATIAESPGTEVELWLTLLTPAQLAIMNDSEGLDEDYSLVSVASPFRVGLARIGNIYAYFDRRALALAGAPVRVADFSADHAKHRALTETQVLAAVLDELKFECDQPIEQRHRAMKDAPSKIADLNARLAESFTGTNACGSTIKPAFAGDIRLMQLNSSPMPNRIASIPFKARPTDNRDDAQGEFIIRLNNAAMLLLPGRFGFLPRFKFLPRCRFVVVRSMRELSWAPGESPIVPEVIAAVRRLEEKDGELPGCDDIGFCQLDMSLRIAIGVQGHKTTSHGPLRDKTGNDRYFRVDRPARNIRPNNVWLGYQWMLFRVHRALDGDFETPICRVRPQYLASLGIQSGGVIVMESAERRATRRLLAAGERESKETETDSGFAGQLGADPQFKFPGIYMDLSARSQLKVVPGQVIWVRRDLSAVFFREFIKIGWAVAIAFLGIAFSSFQFVKGIAQGKSGPALDSSNYPGWLDLFPPAIVLIGLLVILWCAIHNCRNEVRSK